MVFFYYYDDFVCAPACRKKKIPEIKKEDCVLLNILKKVTPIYLGKFANKKNNNNALCYLIPDCTTQLWVLLTA